MSGQSDNNWTVGEVLAWTAAYLDDKGLESPRLRAERLVSSCTGLSRIELYMHFDRPLSLEERAHLRSLIKRSVDGEPLQYVIGEMPFRHVVVRVEPGVLIPRPETETLVSEALVRADELSNPRLLDLGTGSGCIALSLAKEIPSAQVVATDISPEAIAIAERNAQRLQLDDRISFITSDVFESLSSEDPFDLIVSNPPYIPSAALDTLPSEVVMHEPVLALDGGDDGLDVARRIIEEAHRYLKPGGHLLLELDERNATQAAERAVQYRQYQSVVVSPDLNGRNRFVYCEVAGDVTDG